jgi:hypothetical protein
MAISQHGFMKGGNLSQLRAPLNPEQVAHESASPVCKKPFVETCAAGYNVRPVPEIHSVAEQTNWH